METPDLERAPDEVGREAESLGHGLPLGLGAVLTAVTSGVALGAAAGGLVGLLIGILLGRSTASRPRRRRVLF